MTYKRNNYITIMIHLIQIYYDNTDANITYKQYSVLIPIKNYNNNDNAFLFFFFFLIGV